METKELIKQIERERLLYGTPFFNVKKLLRLKEMLKKLTKL